jgi:hypothetical protein
MTFFFCIETFCKMNSGGHCPVTLSTEIHTKGESLERRDDYKAKLGEEEISGCLRQLGLLRQLVPAKVNSHFKLRFLSLSAPCTVV